MTKASAIIIASCLVASALSACVSISPVATDAWCTANCLAAAPYCPPSMCSCEGSGPTEPTPTPVEYCVAGSNAGGCAVNSGDSLLLSVQSSTDQYTFASSPSCNDISFPDFTYNSEAGAYESTRNVDQTELGGKLTNCSISATQNSDGSAVEFVYSSSCSGAYVADVAGTVDLATDPLASTYVAADRVELRNSDLTQFTTFMNLRCVDSFYIEDNNDLVTLSGFFNLVYADDFEIEDNQALTSIQSFNSLERVDDNLYLRDMNSLTNMPHFSSLTYVGDDLQLDDLGVQHIPGFNSLTQVVDNLVIRDNDNLINILGFSGPLEVGDDVDIINNNAMLRIDGFNGLRAVRDNLQIDDNEVLATISGFSSLTFVGDDIEFDGNRNLATINGMQNMETVYDRIEMVDMDVMPSVTFPSVTTWDEFYYSNLGTGFVTADPFLITPNLNASTMSHFTINNCDNVTSINWTPLDRISYISLNGMDSLTNLSPIHENVTSIDSVFISDTAITNVDAFAGVEYIDSANIQNNNNLVDLSGFLNTTFGSLSISGNDVNCLDGAADSSLAC